MCRQSINKSFLLRTIVKAVFVLSMTHVVTATKEEVDVNRKGSDAVIDHKENVSRELQLGEDRMGCGFNNMPCCDDFECRLARTVCDPFQGNVGVGLCVACGEADGTPCCEGMKCAFEIQEGDDDDDDFPLVCAFDGNCVYCGSEGQPCCSGHVACESGLTCSNSGMCVSCGAEGDECCDGMKCVSGAMIACDEHNMCTNCGGPSEPCCEGMKCGMLEAAEHESAESLGLVCAVSGLCEFCGGLNEKCCFNGAEYPVTTGGVEAAASRVVEGVCGMAYREYCVTVPYRGACAEVAAGGFPNGGRFQGLCHPEDFSHEEEEVGIEISENIGQDEMYGGGGRYPQKPKAAHPTRAFKCCTCMAVDLACDMEGICRIGATM